MNVAYFVLFVCFVQSRLGVKTAPDSRRSISTSSPASSNRRRTLPSVDVGAPLTLDGRRRNLSDSQLHAVPSVLRRYVFPSPSRSGQLHVGLQRKLTAPDIRSLRQSPTSGIIQHAVCVCLFFNTTPHHTP